MIIVKLEGKTSIDSALKKLKNKFNNTQVVKELNERKTFKKKSQKRREEIKKARYKESLRRGDSQS